jgi:hypothetical protein
MGRLGAILENSPSGVDASFWLFVVGLQDPSGVTSIEGAGEKAMMHLHHPIAW